MADRIISRADARAQGLKRYFSGEPCKNGHVAELHVSSFQCVVCSYEKARAWHAENRERHLENGRKWALANAAKTRKARSKWQRANPEQGADSQRRRRARKFNAVGSHTRADLVAILKAQNHRCVYCRVDLRKVKRHVDHIHPLADSGSNDRNNIQWLCAPCNQRKSAKDPIQFAQELGRLL